MRCIPRSVAAVSPFIPTAMSATLGWSFGSNRKHHVQDAHGAGLVVVGGTFRRANSFMLREFRSSDNLAHPRGLVDEIRVFFAVAMDQFFPNDTDLGVTTDKEWHR